jgi:hypothetical protein
MRFWAMIYTFAAPFQRNIKQSIWEEHLNTVKLEK